MESFDTLDELWLDATARLIDAPGQPSRDGPTREVLGYCGRVEDATSAFLFNPIRKASPAYAAAEVLWYLSGELTVDRIIAYAPQYERFTDQVRCYEYNDAIHLDPPHCSDGKVVERRISYGAAYGGRLNRDSAGYTQVARIIRILTKDPDSRQAIITLWDMKLDLHHAEAKDLSSLPCTLTLQFILRDGRLNCLVSMRSSDVWLGLPYDAFAFATLQRLIAGCLRVETGFIQFHLGSLHVYDRNYDRMVAAASPPGFSVGGHKYRRPIPTADAPLSRLIQRSLEFEQLTRENKSLVGANYIHDALGRDSLLADLVFMAGSKWDRSTAARHVSWERMAEYLKS